MISVSVPAPASTWYQDIDWDDYGNCNVTIEAPTQPTQYVAICGDCDDLNPWVHPGGTDIPNNGVDEDCNGEDLVDPVPVEGTSWSLLKARYR
jgi:hypothetical protein